MVAELLLTFYIAFYELLFNALIVEALQHEG
jgi:hypothetical protein